MDKIIQKAIEGGWKTLWLDVVFQWKISKDKKRVWFLNKITKRQVSMNTSEIVLDPLFWQSLSRACGWKHKNQTSSYYRHFFKRNYYSGFDKAVEYLEELIRE